MKNLIPLFDTFHFRTTRYCTGILVMSFLLCAGMKCKKEGNLDANGLPKATQSGRNIFACKVNGENWISSTSIYDIGGGKNNDTISVRGANTEDKVYFEDFYIQVNQFHSQKLFELNDSTYAFARYTTNKNCFKISQGYGVGSAKSTDGELIFTKVDTINKILSGTFWFNILTDYCDTLHVTDGRFDIRYY